MKDYLFSAGIATLDRAEDVWRLRNSISKLNLKQFIRISK